MSYKTAFREVMLEYERDADEAKRELLRRKDLVYRQLPQIEKIDSEISSLGVRMAKQALKIGTNDGKNSDNGDVIEADAERISRLSAEKKLIMANNGFPENYLSDINKCEKCKDTGYIGHEKCPCLKQRLIEKYYDLSNIREVIKRENFETFDINFYSGKVNETAGISPRENMEHIYLLCLNFIRDFETSDENLLFYGPPGLGKTFLCNCIAKDVLDMGKTVLYTTAPKLFKLIEQCRFRKDDIDAPDDFMETLTDVDLLVIDDLGTEFFTIVTGSELFNIINERLLTKKHTVISTNISLAEMQKQYSDRLVSRLLGKYRAFKFIGDDIRLKKKYS